MGKKINSHKQRQQKFSHIASFFNLWDNLFERKMKKNNSPAFTAAGVAPAVTLSPFACAAAKLSVPDIADC